MSRLLMLLALLPLSSPAEASFVTLSVEVSGRETPLYPAKDGSGRLYLEARAGASYTLNLHNETGERLAVALDVDGLNVIDGRASAGRERMYVLGPYESTVVRGWRSSLSEVHLFTFVDEAVSYASRTGQANGHMGWIEAKVYREREREQALASRDAARPAPPAAADGAAAEAPAGPPATASNRAEATRKLGGLGYFAGTGWGRTTSDEAVEVSFNAQSLPCQQLTLRYEYHAALVALGVLRRPFLDRLQEREQGTFAEPPVN